MPSEEPMGVILVSVFDGTRNLAPAGKPLRFQLRDGKQREVFSKSRKRPVQKFTLPFRNNFIDDYAVIVSAKGYRQVGFHPARLAEGSVTPVDLMLLPKNPTFQFAGALWNALRVTHPHWTTFLRGRLSEATAAERHGQWVEDTPEHLAAFLNFAAAMDDIRMPVGTAFDYLRQPLTGNLEQDFLVDRMFAFADAALIDQVERAVRDGAFVAANSSLHPGATRSFKEKRFGEANVQITLHEKDRKRIGGVNCLKVEIDMDYFRDPLAHLLLEVLPNQFGGATDPRQIYVLRWVAGRHAGVPEFNPPYRIA